LPSLPFLSLSLHNQSIEPFALFYLPVTLKLISRYLLPDLARVDPIHLDQPPLSPFKRLLFSEANLSKFTQNTLLSFLNLFHYFVYSNIFQNEEE